MSRAHLKPDLLSSVGWSWRLVRRTLLLVGAFMLALGSPSARAHHASAADAARGVVFDGISAARANCSTAYRVRVSNARDWCTHGPDPAPADVDVRRRRRTAELVAATVPNETANATSAQIPCHGDGSSGERVEAVYAVASDRSDRYTDVAPLIRDWLADTAGRVEESAAETQGFRTLRFVTSACTLVVRHVVLSPAGDDDIGNTASELEAQGYDRSDRKYIVFVDATVYCGVAFVGGNVSRVDQGCWNGGTALHELAHNLNAVDPSAPNGTRGSHCTDEADVMCYSDSPDYPPMRSVCESAHERLLDCGHDDYFSTRPESGSFLSQHPELNIADSPFMAMRDGEPATFLRPTPSDYRDGPVSLELFNADDELCGYGQATSGSWVRLFCVGYYGQRTADITGALLELADGAQQVPLRLVAYNHNPGGGRTYGFRVVQDGQIVFEADDGVVGSTSSTAPEAEPDPETGYARFFDRTITISLNKAPLASFGYSPVAPQVSEVVTFRSTSTDSDGTIARADWDLDGNGTYEVSGAVVSRSYARPETISVGIRVADDRGATAASRRTLTIVASGDGKTDHGADDTARPAGCAELRSKLRRVRRLLRPLRSRLDTDYRSLMRRWHRLRRNGWPVVASRRYRSALRRYQVRQRRASRLERRKARLRTAVSRRC